MKLTRGTALILVFLFAASLGYSQQTATGTANANNYTIVNGGGGQGAQATAGVVGTAGTIPGFPIQNGEWGPYWYQLISFSSMPTIESVRNKHDHVSTKVWKDQNGKDLMAPNNNPIRLLSWSPLGDPYPTDVLVSVTDAQGKMGEQPETVLMSALYDAKKEGHSNRCVAFMRKVNEGVTKGLSIGSGQSMGMIMSPGSNNPTVGLATGGVLGINRTYEADYPEFKVVCFNDGPSDPPAPPAAKPSQGASTEQAAPQTPPPSPTDSLVHTFRFEFVGAQPLQAVSSSPSSQTPESTSGPAPTQTASVSPATDPCILPEYAAYFAYNSDKVDPQYLPVIHSLAKWLGQHPSCKIEVEGSACHHGSLAYNADLGFRRALNVYLLLKKEDANGQIIEPVTNSKYFASHEGGREDNAPDRKVIFFIRGSSSDPEK